MNGFLIAGLMMVVGQVETLGPVQQVYTTQGWAVGQQILDGPLAGQYRLVQQQTQTTATSQEQEFLNLVNNWRASQGLHALSWDSNLAAYASMNSGVHQPGTNGGGMQCWASVSDLRSAFHMWINSGPHANILRSATSAIGAALCPSGSTANAR